MREEAEGRVGYPGDGAIREKFAGKTMAVEECAAEYGVSSTQAFMWLHKAGLRKDGRFWKCGEIGRD